MKVPPLNLTPDVNRVGMALPFSPDLLWRYPLSLQQSAAASLAAPPSSPLLDVKNQMPAQLAVDPRLWSREDVTTFLRWFEREFELPKIDSTKFCMNGKALCMLTKNDLADRAPGAGDVLHNTLQFLLRDAPQIPPSPLTPHHPLLSPSPLTTPTSQPWSLVGSDFHTLGHLLQQGGSVTLSPAPSEQSGGSPRHPDPSVPPGSYHHSSSASTGSTHSGSHSDSEDSTRDSSPQRSPIPSQPSWSRPTLGYSKESSEYEL
ncbi:Ets DNA-binding protein pokkuri [Armadillidium nasatum]|uniref:Ets DNA-binding protein pokkuri n=1 Tax=Armadillidium nasatum TaxID=96803 RepID=A0A5N5SNE4_9CRUS|nr:Ets DNA-binding protein pokkuri [Armadillidium nasatum]